MIKYLYHLILDCLFPKKCICGAWGKILCDNCSSALKIRVTQICPYCRKISPDGALCVSCRRKSNLAGLTVLFNYEGAIKEIIKKYKFGSVKEYSKVFNGLYEATSIPRKYKKTTVTFVPITKEHIRIRGYNQAELIAKELASKLGVSNVSLLTKRDKTIPQVGLTKKERLANIKGKIMFMPGQNVPKRVIICDDVFTSGATLEECARVLKAAGVKQVWGFVIAQD